MPAAQKFFQQRARCNGAARYGKYDEHMEQAGLVLRHVLLGLSIFLYTG